MAFYREDGTVENSVELQGKMSKNQFDYFCKKFAANAMRIAERKSYGLGEVGYYINEDCGNLIEFDIATEAEARAIRSEAEELMFKAEDLGATLNEPYYVERLENERDIAKEGDRDYRWTPESDDE